MRFLTGALGLVLAGVALSLAPSSLVVAMPVFGLAIVFLFANQFGSRQ